MDCSCERGIGRGQGSTGLAFFHLSALARALLVELNASLTLTLSSLRALLIELNASLTLILSSLRALLVELNASLTLTLSSLSL